MPYRQALFHTNGPARAEAERAIGRGEPAQAHEHLEQVRDLFAELRHRNGVVVFSDAMNAYHAQMEIVLRDGPALAARQAIGELKPPYARLFAAFG